MRDIGFEDDLFSSKELVNIFLPTSLFQTLVVFHSIFGYFLLRAIWAKTNKTYKEYEDDKFAEKIAGQINNNQNNPNN